MALNFGILQPVNIGGQIMAGRQEAQRNQLAQQQMQTGAMQQEKMQLELNDFKTKQAGLDKFLQMSADNGKTGTPEELANSFYDFALSSRDPQLILASQTMRQAAKERSAYNASRLQQPKMSPVAPVSGALGSGTFDVNAPMPTTNNLAPPPVAPVNKLGDTTALENRIIDLQTNYSNVPQAQTEAAILTKKLDEARKLYTVGGNLVTGTGTSVFTASEKPAAPPSMVAEYTFAKTPDGGNFKGTYQQFVTARAAAGRAPAAPRPEPQPQPPVAVVDPRTGKQVLVSREEALRDRMTPASAMEGLPPKEMQRRESVFPQSTSAIKGVKAKSVGFINDLKALRNHPGLDSITGIAAGRLPGITANGRAAEAIYNKIIAKGGFQALQEMRDASKTGGALGSVSNREGLQLQASFAAIDRRQDARDVRNALDQAIADIEGATVRMGEAYDLTYDYKSGGGAAAPAAPDPLGIRN